MTKRQWIEHRESISEVPWAEIRRSGYDAVPCDCGREGCDGWRLVKVACQKDPLYDAAA